MEGLYNKHYITTDDRGRITDGWSDGPHQDRDAAGAICIHEQGGYQFRLTAHLVDADKKAWNFQTEENPALYTMDGIPRYRWDGEKVLARSDAEIAADRIPPLENVREAKLKELSDACNAAITAGCDVTLSDRSTGHVSLTAEDQINLSTAVQAVAQGAVGYPYHLDGQLCAIFPAADILAMGQAATAHKLYHTTYYNHLAVWVRRCETAEEVQVITYVSALPDDLAASMESIISAVGGESGVV